ncbi:C39 family peptidase [Natronoflexus pectinivorans]|uniref:Peptidase C39-like protein n=1 Tax=Natronoflexus pectinivorans TaxID=682526 RepID=A0A4R2GK35_9BACT|nr:C39 family peptidase [Natronoflexus pectinivorans]TCO09112.1 peptidase C39-like protein [Natronoflexus pectinivorans]
MERLNSIKILPQPDDTTCGPTSLHAVYRFFGLKVELNEVIETVTSFEEGGTLAVMLGIDALKRGFDATIYTYNLKVFDPSWAETDSEQLCELLGEQLKYKTGKKFSQATKAYQNFLNLGGKISFEDLNKKILKRYFEKDVPILTGLSATYLYNTKREYTNRKNRSVFDDLKGEPMGHFVVLCGISGNTVYVADPYKENPISGKNYYEVDTNRLLNSVLLGIVTYDANMLVILPKD